jgi:lipopolysaccharide export system permease protein
VILDRYVLREILWPLLVGLALFFVVILFGEVLKVSDAVTGLGISAGDFGMTLLYSLPPLVGILVPVATLFAVLLGIGRLGSDREVVALAAVGVSPFRLLRVPIWLGFALAAIAAAALWFGEPWGIRNLKLLMAQSAQRALADGVRIGQFNEWVDGMTLLAQARADDGSLEGVLVADRRNRERPLVVSARWGRVLPGATAADIVVQLETGTFLLYGKGDEVRRVTFEEAKLHVDVGELVQGKLSNVSGAQALTPAELWQQSHSHRHDRNRRAQYSVTLHRKLALPFAALLFAVVALPLGCRDAPGARGRGVLFSTAAIAGYYYVSRGLETWARHGKLPPLAAAWGANLGLALIAAVLLWRLRR